MPVSTDVGQSGPPHKTEHLADVNPLSSKMSLMALIDCELTPTVDRTATDLPSTSYSVS